ncbi:outer membrane beta-barrel protein [Ferruginibacter yonginensis]|uniref:Outer membrane beta-barrel protein n=1 Tax=Ferruginibacter yonginensis TaxID=1310416 RepID=A0ABV8QUV4_9BACT
MKRLYALTTLLCAFAITSMAQTNTPASDSTKKSSNNDTIRIGNILIIKKGKIGKTDSAGVIITTKKKNSKVSTNYGIVDFGFSNFNDNTSYGNTGGYTVNKPGSPAFSEADLKLKGGKSININIWFFMQKVALVKQNINLKYGLGLELNNYRFRSPISFKENGTIPYSGGLQTNAPFVFRDSISFSKNKLALDYLTVPVMLNFATNKKPGKKQFSTSFGISAGYLYSQRNKQISDERGKEKNKGDYDVERFKISYIGEIGLGGVRLYGAYTPKSIFERGLDVKTFNVGIRLSNW